VFGQAAAEGVGLKGVLGVEDDGLLQVFSGRTVSHMEQREPGSLSQRILVVVERQECLHCHFNGRMKSKRATGCELLYRTKRWQPPFSPNSLGRTA